MASIYIPKSIKGNSIINNIEISGEIQIDDNLKLITTGSVSIGSIGNTLKDVYALNFIGNVSGDITATNILATNITTNSLNSTNQTTVNSLITNLSSSSLNAVNISNTNQTTTNLQVNSSTFGSLILTVNPQLTIKSDSYGSIINLNAHEMNGHNYRMFSTSDLAGEGSKRLIIQNSSLEINPICIGSSGNIGVNNNLNPQYNLDILGTLRSTIGVSTGYLICNLVSTGTLNSLNQTTTNIVVTNLSASNLITSFITTGSLLATNFISTANLLSTNMSCGTISNDLIVSTTMSTNQLFGQELNSTDAIFTNTTTTNLLNNESAAIFIVPPIPTLDKTIALPATELALRLIELNPVLTAFKLIFPDPAPKVFKFITDATPIACKVIFVSSTLPNSPHCRFISFSFKLL